MSQIIENIKDMVRGVINEYNSPDHVFFTQGNKTRVLRYRDANAIGFYLESDGNFVCKKSKSHTQMRGDIAAQRLGYNNKSEFFDYAKNLEDEDESQDLIDEFDSIMDELEMKSEIEGRYWSDSNVISFWYEIPSLDTINLIIKKLSDFIGEQIDIKTLHIATEESTPTTEEMFNSDSLTQLDKEKQEDIKALHLMNAEEKVQTSQMKDYLKNRSENTGKKLKYSSSKGEMPMAQYRALKTTSENKTITNNNKMRLTKKDIKKAINEAFSDIVQHNHIMADYDFDDYDEDDYKYMSDEDIASQYEDFEITHLEAEPARYGEGFTGTIEITFPNADDVDYNSTTVDNFFVYDDNLTKFGFENWYPEDVVEKLKMEIRDYINKNLKKTTALESKIRQIVQETVCEIGQRYNGEYDRTGRPSDDEKYIDSLDYIIDSVINGNTTQVRKLVNKLTFEEFFALIELARENGCDEKLKNMVHNY